MWEVLPLSETSSNIVEGYTTGTIPTYNLSCLTSKSKKEWEDSEQESISNALIAEKRYIAVQQNYGKGQKMFIVPKIVVLNTEGNIKN